MSMETYERIMLNNDIYRKLAEGERSIEADEVMEGFDSLKEIKTKYRL